VQDVAIGVVVTVEAPAVLLVVREDDVRVELGELTARPIDRHGGVT
jgi:hypothetical protein